MLPKNLLTILLVQYHSDAVDTLGGIEIDVKPNELRDMNITGADIEALLSDMTDNPNAMYFVAELSGEIIGYAGVWKIMDEGHINNVGVLPRFRNRKIGKTIMKTLLDITESQGIKSHSLDRKSDV